ncbi:helix-turn-helix domain-containing protein [Mechercharimyces sp. CAU 1602]|uniref:helix-turn-helix domain-containing protein n=1 Tax=Mechercharimyces sp. CAU 1602 TaxID=2973933 RepID=UPI0021611F22|nr:helix-turn-helix domain-containing protein [Mechercharimyces sp. CAU 1602]MCS1350549.1 hypothetical protein [Mechercharimyces sp. CAU 1602]
MGELHTKEVGEILRRIRKEKALRIEDLADEHISSATISNIERGVPHVMLEKIQYLMDLLGIDETDLKRIKEGVEQEWSFVELELLAIETMSDVDEVDEALKKLKEFRNISSEHPTALLISYIKGKCLNKKGEWEKARKELLNAIRLSPSHPLENIEACAYCELMRQAYYTNDLEQAVRYAEKGLDAFVPEGKHEHMYDVLMVNKISCLNRLNRVGEAFSMISEIWSRKEEIQKPSLLLLLYFLRVNLLRKTGHYEEAIETGREGIRRARMTNEYDRILLLWDSLGSVYLRLNDLKTAEVCFDFTTMVQKKVHIKDPYVSTLTKHGILYMRKGDLPGAERKLEEAILLGKRSSAQLYLIDALVIMGDLQKEKGNIEQAITYYRESLERIEGLGLNKKKHAILFRLVKCLEGGDQQEFREQLTNMFYVQKEISGDFSFEGIL